MRNYFNILSTHLKGLFMLRLQAELRKKFETEEAPKFLGFIEKQITTYGKDGFAVSSSVSIMFYGVNV